MFRHDPDPFADALAAVTERIERYTGNRDFDAITNSEAKADADRLLRLSVQETPQGQQFAPVGIQVTAALYWNRCGAIYHRGDLPDYSDEVTAIALIEDLRALDPLLLPPNLRDVALDARQLFREGNYLIRSATATPEFDHHGVRVAVRKLRLAAQFAQGSEDYPVFLGGLGATLVDLYQCARDPADLDEAIIILRAALAELPTGHASIPMVRAALGGALARRFTHSQDMSDVDDAERELRTTLVTYPPEMDRTATLADLASVLVARAEHTADPADLDAAIEATRVAATAMPDRHPSFADFHVLLSQLLARRARSSPESDMDGDLAEAITVLSRVREASPPDSVEQLLALGRLVLVYLFRYRLLGSPTDFDAAADLYSMVEGSDLESRHEVVPVLLPELRAAMRQRHPVTGEFSDSTSMEQALKTTISMRGYDRPELDTTISVLRLLVRGRMATETDAEPTGDDADERLADTAAERFRATGDRLGLAYVLNLRAHLRRRPVNSPEWTVILGRMAKIGWDAPAGENSLLNLLSVPREMRRAPNVDPADLEEAVAALGDCRAVVDDGDLACLNVHLACALRLRATTDAGTEEYNREAVNLFRAAARAAMAPAWLRLYAATSAARSVAELGDRSEAATDYATAIELLHAPEADPDQAQRRAREYSGLASEAAAVALNADSPERAVELLERGRAVLWTGGAESDRPLPFTELRRAASLGPVVLVNVSRVRCDALVISASEPVTVVPLDIRFEEVMDTAARLLMRTRPGYAVGNYVASQEELGKILQWLGERILGPVLGQVGDVKRIWWCPTGPLALLPLHAAALEQVESSYTITLAELLRARSAPPHQHRLVVGVSGAPDSDHLSNVDTEIAAVAGPDDLVLRDEQATAARVLAELPRYAWAHFACHAFQDVDDPTRSYLALRDRPLTVAEIAGLRLRHAELAFLSACESSASARLPDEAISLSAALQHAGYRHVIAALWPIPDRPEMAAEFYRIMTEHPEVSPATALHRAACRLRRERPYEPTLWAAHQHFGP